MIQNEHAPTQNRTTDVLIIGTGCAGLTAALAAHEQGAHVTILEKTELVGGTTAVSAGALWIPCNHHLIAAGFHDSREEAIRYITSLADGRGDAELIELFVDRGPDMLRFVEQQTTLKLEIIPEFPDYHPEMDGGAERGRSLEPGIFDTRTLGEWAAKLRRSPIFGALPLSINELRQYGLNTNPMNTPIELVQQRLEQGIVSFGTALAGHLLAAVLERGIEPVVGTRVRRLITRGDRVVGVEAEQDGKTVQIMARRGIVLASGGFEWDKQLNAQFLGGHLTHPQSPPANEGDGLRMAMALGANLGNMSEAWWCPSVALPGETYAGQPLHRGDFTNRGLPHSLIVNRTGKRFVNEALNYNDITKALLQFDPTIYDRPNLPAWLIVDQNYLSRYALHSYIPIPGVPLPDWLIRADSLEELAGKLEIDPQALVQTVERFNEFARSGVDADYGRGATVHDRDYGDASHGPNPSLGTIESGPFCAVPLHVGALGTKGGVRVNHESQVLHVSGQPIEGLYAAGNVMAGITGAGYPGGGATIGPAMTFGYIAGTCAAQKRHQGSDVA
ncbi:MAG TPA: FAD-dependent oxidoreductase [Herpetosiphonaceae bacterium]